MMIRSVLLCCLECWPIKKIQVRRLIVAEMRMFRWMCGHTRLNYIRNEALEKKYEPHLWRIKRESLDLDGLVMSIGGAQMHHCGSVSGLISRNATGVEKYQRKIGMRWLDKI